MSAQLSTFVVEPTAAHRGTVIWMHGLGATNHDFDDVVPLLDAPGVRFVFPAAPMRPVTINGGMVMPAWYDIVSFSDPPLREDEATLRDAEASVTQLLDAELTRRLPADKTVLLGFSQGGALALHVGIRYAQSLAGIGVLSGYLLLPQRLEAERQVANAKTPLLFCHGEFDPIVPCDLGLSSFEAMVAAGYQARWHTFPMQHSLCMPEIMLLKDWLSQCGLR